jgi:autoinducer 2-degrading protein
MLVVHVHVRVKPECVDAFKAATLANAQASVREAGIARFAAWRDAVAPMMAEPRTSVKFGNVFPDDGGW